MRMVIVRIEDNREKINEINTLRENGLKVIDEVSTELDKLQEEAFMQIAAYVKCCVDDYIGICGGAVTMCNEHWGYRNRLSVSCFNHTVSISADHKGMVVDFNYTGTPKCKDTPRRMRVDFKDDRIVIAESERRGINDLMIYWKHLKPEFQKKIDEAYDKYKTEINKKVETYEYLLKNAKSFKV